jgi:uncharacterized protein (DUF58 family)
MQHVFGKNVREDVPLSDPTALAKFGRLEVVAKLVVEGYLIGQHKSPFKGASIEFVEHRQYYPGDEIRHIDWRAFGKTGKYYIKEFEDETNLRAYLLVDASGSMAYAGKSLSKWAYARQVAAALSYLLLSQRDAVGLITFDTEVRDRTDPATAAHSFERIAEMLEGRQPGGETSLADVLVGIVPTLKRRSLVFVLSDLFDSVDKLLAALKELRHSRHEVVLLHVVASEEEDFPFTRPTQFRNLERVAHRVLVDPHRLRKHYLENYRRFCRELSAGCGGLGVDYFKLLTTDPYDRALGAYLDSRSHSKLGGAPRA